MLLNFSFHMFGSFHFSKFDEYWAILQYYSTVYFYLSYRTYGAGSLDEICDQIKFVQTSSASLSALVCVYQVNYTK